MLEPFLGGKSQLDFMAAPEQEVYRVYLHGSEVRPANERRRRHVRTLFTATTVSLKKKASEASEAVDSSTECSEIILEDATSTIDLIRILTVGLERAYN